MFLVYINDLPNISEGLNFYLFADDTNIYYEAETVKILEAVINRELRKLDTWLIVNRLSLNIAKTKFLVFHPYNKPMKQRITLKIHKKAITENEYIKYLGIMVDSTLSWNIHIDKISETISRATGLLYKIRPSVNNKNLKMLYYSLVYPHLNYVTEVWGSADPIHLNRIFILQKRIVRMLTLNDVRQNDYSFPSSNPLFFKLEILKIQVKIDKFIYKCLNNNTPINFHNWFLYTTQIHNYNTRSGYSINNYKKTYLFLPHGHLITVLKLIKVHGPKIWNELPPDVRVITSFGIFKVNLNRHMVNNYKSNI